ncbi:hypothetical protein V6N11_041319 [Hibiscus sabdariffa]|uniref:Uncharacterized protein n=1 Tax=Hibiscus sabdariffa TaxID=183260 RepID=A0ABR2RK40_9ROSI
MAFPFALINIRKRQESMRLPNNFIEEASEKGLMLQFGSRSTESRSSDAGNADMERPTHQRKAHKGCMGNQNKSSPPR